MSYMPLNSGAYSDEDEKAQPTNGDRRALQKEDVLRWLQQSSESDAVWILTQLLESMPHLFGGELSAKLISESTKESSAVELATKGPKKKKRNEARKSLEGMIGDPVIQFSSPKFYAAEGVDDTMILDVMRIGNKEGTAEVFYETEDGSALAGRSYVATSGKLLFQPGDSQLQIEVPIINNDVWDTTTDFICRLKPEGLKGAVLGQYLYMTRVNIIDNNSFPTDSFNYLTTQQKIAECPKWPLLFGFVRMVLNIPKVWMGAIKFMMVDFIENVWLLLDLIVMAYLLDFVIDASSPEKKLLFIHARKESLVLCASTYFLGIFVSHVLDYVRISFPVAGPASSFLQAGLFRKFLNYKRIVRERLQAGAIVMGIERDCVEVVNSGFVNLLTFLGTLGKIFIMLLFQFIHPAISGGHVHWFIFLIILPVPVVLIIFAVAREKMTNRALAHRDKLFYHFTDQISITEGNCGLVLDYNLQSHAERLFLEKQQMLTVAGRAARQILMNNAYICKWCKTICLVVWLTWGGMRVIDSSVTVGFFVANVKLFGALGDGFVTLNNILISMTNTFPSLETITRLMNLETDVKDRYRYNRARRAESHKNRVALRQDLEQGGIAAVSVDMMPIVLKFQEAFKFEGREGFALNFKGQVEIHQGQMVAVTGNLGCGKATLLRLIGGSVLPEWDTGAPVFVPSFLRVANVANDPLFFGGSIYQNLIFGMEEGHPEASRDRARKICKLLTRSEIIEGYFDSDEEEPWQDIFSLAQCKLLGLVRALVHNCEVACIHKPLAHLSLDDGERLLKILHNHVEGKGLEMSSDPTKRRLRTLIISASEYEAGALQYADNIVMVDRYSGIRMLSGEQ